MAENNSESLDEILKINKNKIENDFDLILLFTCWYLNYKGYKFGKTDDDEDANLLLVWKNLPFTFRIKNQDKNQDKNQELQILIKPFVDQFMIYFETLGIHGKSKQVTIQFVDHINSKKEIIKQMMIIEQYLR